MRKPILGTKKTIFRNEFQELYCITADFGAFRRDYFITDYGVHVGVAVLHDNTILMVSQYRVLVDRWTWEIPGGRADEGETPEKAAARECEEETGIRCRDLKSLIHYLPGPDTICNPTHIFYTSAYEPVGPPDHEAGEQVAWIPVGRCLEMLRGSEIVDTFTQTSLFALHFHNLLLERP